MVGSGDDGSLIRALCEGASVLSSDLHRLHAHLMLIHGLMAEKALEREPSWKLAETGLAETATLQRLEAAVLERVASVEAHCLLDIANKLAIWAALEDGAEEPEDGSLRDAIVRSVRRDLDAILRATVNER